MLKTMKKNILILSLITVSVLGLKALSIFQNDPMDKYKKERAELEKKLSPEEKNTIAEARIAAMNLKTGEKTAHKNPVYTSRGGMSKEEIIKMREDYRKNEMAKMQVSSKSTSDKLLQIAEKYRNIIDPVVEAVQNDVYADGTNDDEQSKQNAAVQFLLMEPK
jgi:hypothetical protein